MARPQTPSKHIGINIRTARQAMGLSQTQLAHAIGHNRDDVNAGAYISRVEAGKPTPSINTLAKIARVLKTSIETLTTKQV